MVDDFLSSGCGALDFPPDIALGLMADIRAFRGERDYAETKHSQAHQADCGRV